MKNRQMQALLAAPDGLGTALREARGHLSMQKLANLLAGVTDPDSKVSKWTSSKVSKMEGGQQLPTDVEVRLWAKATDADQETLDRWLRLLAAAESKRSVYRRRNPAVRDSVDSSAGHLEAVAALTRVVQLNVIPDLLQVESYTRAVLAPTHPEDEIDAVVADLQTRQQVLHAGERHFHFLIGEAALRTIRGSKAVMATQLDRLVGEAAIDTVTIGIIPLGVPLVGPRIAAGFTLYDLDEAVVDDGVEEHRYTGSHATLLRERLDAAWADATQDRAARRLILDAVDALELG